MDKNVNLEELDTLEKLKKPHEIEELIEKNGEKNSYYCYIISNEHDRTYNGYTVNLSRRLRQHNGVIKGGARATSRRGPWDFLIVITSPCWASVSTAMQHEWSIKYPTRRRPRPKEYNGRLGRLNSLPIVFQHIKDKQLCNASNNMLHCYVHANYYDYMCDICKAYEDMIVVKLLDELNLNLDT
jgi:predicted GIY-YIG superfamily endonuclease